MISRIWFVMRREYASNDVLIQVQSECQIELLGDTRAAISRVALFHFHDGINDLFAGSLWTRLAAAT